MRFRGHFAAVALVAVLALTGCAAAPTSRDQPSSVPESASAADTAPVAEVGVGEAPDPLGLVNLWRVTGAEGEAANTWLRIDATELQLWRDCGITTGSWVSSGPLLRVSTWAADAACAPTMTVPWLESVRSFRALDDGWELINVDGDIVATLTIDGAPAPIPSAAEFYTQPPVITDATRKALRQPVPLPAGFVPVTPGELVGRWMPLGYDGPGDATEPFALFAADGTWEGSDGCNGGRGSWAGADGGVFLATSGPSTLIGCDGASVPSSVSQAKLVAIDGDVLRLLDIDGVELMQLERA